MFLIAKRAEKDDFSQKSDEDGLSRGQALWQALLFVSGLCSVYGGIVFEYLTAILG